MLPQGLGRFGDHRRRRRGQEISTRPFQLVTGRVWKGTAFGGARAAPTCRRSSTGTWTRRSTSTISSPTMPLQDINKGFDLMKAGTSIRSVVIY